MSEIDPDKLAAAVAYYDNDCRPAAPQFYELLAAARAHLATLPRFKEVEVEAFAVFDSDGEAVEIWLVEENARLDAKDIDGTIVRLTGTAKVRA